MGLPNWELGVQELRALRAKEDHLPRAMNERGAIHLITVVILLFTVFQILYLYALLKDSDGMREDLSVVTRRVAKLESTEQSQREQASYYRTLKDLGYEFRLAELIERVESLPDVDRERLRGVLADVLNENPERSVSELLLAASKSRTASSHSRAQTESADNASSEPQAASSSAQRGEVQAGNTATPSSTASVSGNQSESDEAEDD